MKRMKPMHYELYVDSLFLINLCMNLYLLILAGKSIPGTATPWRLLAGAAAGALCSLLPFLGNLPGTVKFVFWGCAGTAGMICIAFPVRGFRMFLKLLERLLLYSLGMGGGLLLLIGRFPAVRGWLTAGCGILFAGGILFLFLGSFRKREGEEASICRATLVRGSARLTVAALIDSGNSLVEPISGKPVCVVEERLYKSLWGNEMTGYRAIPYHSIGKSRGIMPGYLLPLLLVETEGIKLRLEDVYVAVSREPICHGEGAEGESVKMIINPALLQGGCGREPRKRQNERKYDSESGNTGKNAVKNETQGKRPPA